MKNSLFILALLSSILFGITGCEQGQQKPDSTTGQAMAAERDTANPKSQEQMRSLAIDMRRQVKDAIMDLSGRLQVPPNEIKVVQAKTVNWPDGSLGCPRKGMSYTHALVPGVLIILNSGSKDYHYHSGKEGVPAYCATPQAPVPATSRN